MSDANETAGPPAAHRVDPRRIVAVVVAAVMLLGIAGLVLVAVLGGDDTPTGEGLQTPIDVAAPATAAAAPAPDGSVPEVESAAAAAPVPPHDTALTGDDFAVAVDGGGDAPSASAPSASTPSASTAESAPAETLDSMSPPGTVSPSGVVLPEPSEPVQLPALIAPPAPASSVAVATLADFEPARVAALDGFDVTTRDDDYLELSDGSTVIEVFVLDDSPPTAEEALARFFAGIAADVDELEESPATRLPAPSSRYVSVSGAQFTAVDAQQQGTRSITGSALAGIDEDGHAIVVTASRPGSSSLTQRTLDAERIAAVLARVAP